MIELPVEQGTQAWFEARLGIPTASQFSRIVTPSGKLSASRDEYLAELLAAYFVGEPDAETGAFSEWVERGKLLEPQAISAYAFRADREPRRPGLCYLDETRMIAASPDWLIEPDGCGEVKCPMARTHLLWLARGALPRDHYAQVQGQLYVTGRGWCDFVSFCPGLPILILRVEPDKSYQAALAEHLPIFVEEVLAGRQRLRDMGVFDPHRDSSPAAEAADRRWFDETFEAGPPAAPEDEPAVPTGDAIRF